MLALWTGIGHGQVWVLAPTGIQGRRVSDTCDPSNARVQQTARSDGLSQPFMLEASDHTGSVTLLATVSTIMLQVIYEVEYDQLQAVIG